MLCNWRQLVRFGVALRSQRPRLVGRPAGRHSDVVSSVRTYTTDQSDDDTSLLTRVDAEGSRTSLVIFDKDGTLICFHAMWTPWALKTAQQIALASNLDAEHISSQVYELLGYCPVAKRVRPGLLAEGTYAQIRESMVAMLVRNGLAQDDATRIVTACVHDRDTDTVDSVKALHDLQELFASLRAGGIKIAVCTADNRTPTMNTLKQLNLLDMVDVVVCGDDIDTQPKPHPHNALLICSQLGIDPKEAYMVGDTLADVKMGRSAQLRGSIGVLSGVSSASDLAPHSDHIIEHVGHILPYVKNVSTPAAASPTTKQQEDTSDSSTKHNCHQSHTSVTYGSKHIMC